MWLRPQWGCFRLLQEPSADRYLYSGSQVTSGAGLPQRCCVCLPVEMLWIPSVWKYCPFDVMPSNLYDWIFLMLRGSSHSTKISAVAWINLPVSHISSDWISIIKIWYSENQKNYTNYKLIWLNQINILINISLSYVFFPLKAKVLLKKKHLRNTLRWWMKKKMRTYYLTVYYTPESEGGDKQD